MLDVPREQIAALLNGLLDKGVNVIDTAVMYRDSEWLIGEAIGHRRDEYVLISKCGRDADDIDAPAWTAGNVTQAVDRSLKIMGTDRLDVCLLHSCEMDDLKRGDAWNGLIECRDAGKVKFIGYSGDGEAAAYAAAMPELSVIQTSINLFDQNNIDMVLPQCVERDIGVMVKRPIANAVWRSDAPEEYTNYRSEYAKRMDAMAFDPAKLPEGAPSDWAELALRFSLHQPGVHTAIVGTTNPRRIEQNIAIAGKPPLPDDVVQAIRKSFRDAEQDAGEAWPGQT